MPNCIQCHQKLPQENDRLCPSLCSRQCKQDFLLVLLGTRRHADRSAVTMADYSNVESLTDFYGLIETYNGSEIE